MDAKSIRLEEYISTLNQWGASRVPFLFFIDFEFKKPVVLRLNEINPEEILFSINGFTNAPSITVKSGKIELMKSPIAFEEYKNKFDRVTYHLGYGDSFLTNLTVKTPVAINHSLPELFASCKARYTCWYKDEFLVFSPETFIQIKGKRIYSFPMKGTIDARVPNAKEIISNNEKEKAEHVTIVDLIRNDISQVATNVVVSRFRYIEEIKTGEGSLLQVSSEITGTLSEDWRNRIGDILISLLPAGSVSGAPKPKTLEIIRNVEAEERGYYTGVMGYFDGENLDSGVMIRFVEKSGGKYFYRSGGGITTQSVAEEEFQEVIDKIYVPVD